MTGGLGGDVFIFAGGFGRGRITYFNTAAVDEFIDLSLVGQITDFAALVANHLSSNPVGNAVINTGAGSVITLIGVLTTDLTASDFLF